jgi:hypothetical protein
MLTLKAVLNQAVLAVALVVEEALVEGEEAVVVAVVQGEAEGCIMQRRGMKIPEVDLAAGGGGAEIAAWRGGKE